MLNLSQFGAQLLQCGEEIFSLFLLLCFLLLQLLILPPQSPHAFLQLLFVAFQQFQEIIRALSRLKGNKIKSCKNEDKYLYNHLLIALDFDMSGSQIKRNTVPLCAVSVKPDHTRMIRVKYYANPYSRSHWPRVSV